MNKRVFFILALSMFSSTLGIGIVAPLLPLYAKEMGASGLWLGTIVAAFAISNSIVVPIAGRLSDRRGRKLLLLIGLSALTVISLGYIWANSPAHLSLVRFIQGAAGAATFPIAMAYLGDLSPEGEEGKWMGYANAAFFSGFGFGPFLGGVVTEHFGMTVAFLTMGGFNLLAFLIALFYLPEVSRRKTSEDRHLSFKEMSTSSMMKGLFSFRLGQAVGGGGIFAFLPVFAAMAGSSTSLIGVLLTANYLSPSLLTPFGGILADRFNRRALTIAGNVLASLIIAVIPLTNGFGQLFTVLLIQGIMAAVTMPAASALTVEEGRRYGMGSTMSIFFMANSIGMTVGPIVSGGIADWFNVGSVFYFGAIAGLIGTALFAWFTRQHRG